MIGRRSLSLSLRSRSRLSLLSLSRSASLSLSLSRSRSRSPSSSARTPGASLFNTPRRQPFNITHARTGSRSSYPGPVPVPTDLALAIQVHPPPDSPMSPEPPTADIRDIHLQALASSSTSAAATLGAGAQQREVDPPAYSPLDAYTYSEGVHIDLPAEVITAALEGGTLPPSAIGASNISRSDRRRGSRPHRDGR